MSAAPRSTTHVADALTLLTSAYRGRPNVEAILRALANRTQELENVFWSLVDAVQLAGSPVGVWLDALGEIAGEPRLNRGDAEYLLAVRARLRVNRSKGRTIDVLETMALIGVAFQYNEAPDDPGEFFVDTYGLLYPATVARLLALLKAAGTRAVLRYTDIPRTPIDIAGPIRVQAPLVWGETLWADTVGGSDLTSWCSSVEAVHS